MRGKKIPGFINPVVRKKNNVFKIASRLLAFPKIPESFAHKFNFQLYRETKMSHIILFWSSREIKMPRNIVFRLKRESENFEF